MKFITIIFAVYFFGFNAYSSLLTSNSQNIDTTVKNLICSTPMTEIEAIKKLGDLIVNLDTQLGSLDIQSLQRKQLDIKRDYVSDLQRIFVKDHFSSIYSIDQYCSGEDYPQQQEVSVNDYSYFVDRLEIEIRAMSDDKLEVIRGLGDVIVDIDVSRGSLNPDNSQRRKLDNLRDCLSDIQLKLAKGNITSSKAKAKVLEHGVER